MKSFISLTALALTVIVVASPAYAQQGGPPEGGPGRGPRMACKDDVQTFCKGVSPGGGRILDCLKDHYKDISDGCYQVLQKMASHGGAGGHDGPPPGGGPQGGSPSGSQQGSSHDGPPPPMDDDEGNDSGSPE